MSDFLDNIMKSVDKYITAAGVVAGEFAETAKVKADMYGVKKKRDQVLIEIGESVLRMYLRGNYDMSRVSEKCRYAHSLNEQLREMEHEEKNIHKSSKKHHHRKKHRKYYKEPEKENQDISQQSDEPNLENTSQDDGE